MHFLNSKEIIMTIFIIMPVVTLIHEIGHACIAKVFGCRLKRIVIGKGKKILSLGILEIKNWYFISGWYETYDMAQTKAGRVMVHLGGILFNLISVLIAVPLLNENIGELHWILRIFIVMSVCIIISCLLPLTYDGMNNDGKQIYQVIKYGKSSFRIQKETSSLNKMDL